jgi:hypothetical protein
MNVKEWIDREVRPLLSGEAMHCEPDADKMAVTVVAWKMLDQVEKAAKAKKEKLRVALLKWAEKLGSPTEKGGQHLHLAGHDIIREKRVAATPDDSQLKMLMMGKKMPVTDLYDEVKTYVFNPSKLQNLIDRGVFTKEEVAAIQGMHEVSWALRVEANTELNLMLEGAKR